MVEANMVEEREEFMVSLTGSDPTHRLAYFLKPSVNETLGVTGILSPSLSFPHPTFDPQNWPLKVSFRGWRYPLLNWAKWVNLMLPHYKSVWEQAGICDAILSTTHEIRRDDDLVCGIVERWCPETKSFVFVWGEATITLEDVMVLGGFSVTGQPVSLPLVTKEMKETEERLAVARKEVEESGGKFRLRFWLKKFMCSGSDIELEAFLVFWLSRFIFPECDDLIRISTFPIAIHLARGTRIALAPSVLATIYKDLTLLKQAIVDSIILGTCKEGDDVPTLTLLSPFLLVQLWLWERFPQVQPVPNMLNEGDTRSARWHVVNRVRVGNVRSVLDSAGESFLWRPYTKAMRNWKLNKFYRERGGWIHIDSGLHEELLSFPRCIRVSQLVGLGVVEQYLPHRVAMQFGMDQDLPANISEPDATPEIAWRNYCKPIDKKLYIPSRLLESDVTVKYLEWWKKSVLCKLGVIEGVVQRPRGSKRLKQTMRSCNGLGNNNKAVEAWEYSLGKSQDSEIEPVTARPRSCNGHNNLCNKAVEDCEHFFGKSHPLTTEPVNESGDDWMVEENMSFHSEAPMGGGGSGAKMQGTDETIALDFEVRVTKMEELFVKLKAAKLRRGLE